MVVARWNPAHCIGDCLVRGSARLRGVRHAKISLKVRDEKLGGSESYRTDLGIFTSCRRRFSDSGREVHGAGV